MRKHFFYKVQVVEDFFIYSYKYDPSFYTRCVFVLD